MVAAQSQWSPLWLFLECRLNNNEACRRACMFKSSGLSAYLDTQLSIQGRCFKKPGQIFWKSAVLAGIHVTVIHNFPSSP